MKTLLETLQKKQLTLSSCESLTGGMFASNFVSVPGASTVFKGALVTYQTKTKAKLLQTPIEQLIEHGVISAWTAKLMARQTQSILDSRVCVSFTGNAGPDVMEDKPVGTVFIGYAIDDQCVVDKHLFKGNRMEIREQCIRQATKRLNQLLEEVKDGREE